MQAVWALSYGGLGTDNIAEEEKRGGSNIRRKDPQRSE